MTEFDPLERRIDRARGVVIVRCRETGDPIELPLLSRTYLGEVFGVHVDTVSHWVKTRGLGIAVVDDGGRGKEAYFDPQLAMSWYFTVVRPDIGRSIAIEDMDVRREHMARRYTRRTR